MDTTNNSSNNKKKKILIFVPKFPVLSETFIARDIAQLVELNTLDITVLTLEKGTGELPKNLENKLSIARLSLIDSFFAVLYFLTKPKKVFEAYKLVLKDTTKSLFARKYLWLKSLGYTHIFSKFAPEEIHVHFLSDPSTIAMLASIILDIPFSINAHARDVTEYPSLPKEKIKRAKFVSICNTHAYNKAVTLAGVFADKIKLIRHGIDEKTIFSYPQTLKKPSRPLIFSGGTRFVEKKGLEYLVKASEILKKRGISHEVHITGGGPLADELKSLINKLGLEDIVYLHGGATGIPFSEISQYYRIADVLVLPSIALASGDADGIPNSLIEASLAKLAIVTTNAGSITEFITNDLNGIIVSQKDAEAIATAVEKIIFDSSKRTELGENAYKKAKEMFDITANVQLLANQLLL